MSLVKHKEIIKDRLKSVLEMSNNTLYLVKDKVSKTGNTVYQRVYILVNNSMLNITDEIASILEVPLVNNTLRFHHRGSDGIGIPFLASVNVAICGPVPSPTLKDFTFL